MTPFRFPLRRLLLAAGVLLVLCGLAGYAWVRFYLNDYLREKITEDVRVSSGDLYRLDMRDLRANLLTGSIEITRATLRTDSVHWDRLRQANPEKVPLKIRADLGKLEISWFQWLHFWRKKHLKVGNIQLEKPEFEIVSVKDTVLEQNPETDSLTKNFLDRLPEMLAPFAKSLQIKMFQVNNGKIRHQTLHPGNATVQEADSIYWTLSRIDVRPDTSHSSGKALNALLTPKDNIQLEEGQVQRVRMSVRVRSGEGRGEMEVEYRDLKVTVLDEETRKKRPLMSGLVNLLVRNDNDPDFKGKPFRTATIEYTRESHDGFLRYLWRTARMGLLRTMLPEDMKIPPPKD